MDKRVRIRSSNATEKRANYLKDKMSHLPDEIIVSVLSRLTLKEAARTSVLSRRWEKLWTFITSLNFDGTNTLDDVATRIKLLQIEKPRFMNWVNQVLKSHQGKKIDEFRVRFDLDKSSSSDIDSWINFAMKRSVQRIELDFGNCYLYSCSEHYTLPMWAPEISNFNSLTDLSLNFVDVTGEVLEHLLYNSRFLERVCVKSSKCLVNLKVSGLALRLKYLEISYCFKIQSIDISAVNLESFKYFGPEISMPFKNFPPLVEASFGGDFCRLVTNNFRQLSSYFTRLEMLSLKIHLRGSKEFFNIPVLSNLKHLDIKVHGYSYKSLPFLSSFIKASPFLRKFVLQKIISERDTQVDVLEPTKCPHQCLKVVELLGFGACTNDVEVALYLLANAVSLEKIVFDTRSPSVVGRPWQFDKVEVQQEGRKWARQLGTKLPPGANLVVI